MRQMKLHLATNNGLVTVQEDDSGWHVVGNALGGLHITSVIAREGSILAGTTDGIYASPDGGLNWVEASDGLTLRHIRWLAYHPDVSDLEFAGTEPAGIFVSRDGGVNWRECTEVSDLRRHHGWWLPYSTGAGCVRGFAFHGNRGYAAVEVGAVLRSDDQGHTWRLAGGSDGRPSFGHPQSEKVHPDVHSITVHPSSPDLVLAPTGGGLFGSENGGETWSGLYPNCYVRAIWRDPAEPAHMISGPSESSSGRNGRIEESHDGGRTWQVVSEYWPQNMVERFIPVNGRLLAVMANGGLLGTSLARIDWQPMLPAVTGISALTTMA